jgi:hypothetical protein
MGRRPGEPDIAWKGRDPLAYGMSQGRSPSYTPSSHPSPSIFLGGGAGTHRGSTGNTNVRAADSAAAGRVAATAVRSTNNVGWGVIVGAAAFGLFRLLSPTTAEPDDSK